MEVTTCSHREHIGGMVDGIERGECSICHQVRQYDRRGPIAIAEITKLGRIDGAVVLPGPKEKLSLSSKESAELKGAKEVAVAKPATKSSKDRRKRTSCEKCKFHLIHDDQSWCTIKKCPSRYPVEIRPPYRPSTGKERHSKPESHHRGMPSIEDVAKAVNQCRDRQLPEFPEFKDSWPFTVQEKWLEIFLELRKLEYQKQ